MDGLRDGPALAHPTRGGSTGVLIASGLLAALGIALPFLGATDPATQLERLPYALLLVGLASLPGSARQLRTRTLAAGILALVLTGVVSRFGVIDDGYISLRYARNFAEGRGLVFNPGERVEGYTSFLWVVLLGGLHRVTGIQLEGLAVGIGILCASGCIALVGGWTERRHAADAEPRLGIPGAALLLGLYWPLTFWAFSGMETSLHLLLLLLASRFLLCSGSDSLSRSLRAGGLFFGLAALARPETYLWIVFAAGWVMASGKGSRLRRGVTFLAPAALIVVPHLLFRLGYYGDLLPNTFYVKVDFSSTTLMRKGMRYLSAGLPVHAPLLVAAALGLYHGARRHPARTAYLLLMLAAQTVTTLWTGGDHFRELRFFVPMVPFLVLAAGPFLHAVAAWSLARTKVWPVGGWALLAFGAWLSFVFLWNHGDLGRDSSLRFGRAITLSWVRAGRWLEAHAAPTDWLATPVAGALPYESRLRTIDMLGLTDRTIGRKSVQLGAGPKDHEKYDSAYVLARDPEWIYLGAFAARSLAEVRPRVARMPVLADFVRIVPPDRYEIVTDRYEGAPFTFLHRVR